MCANEIAKTLKGMVHGWEWTIALSLAIFVTLLLGHLTFG